jgi:NADH-quinone oxidoreductase subunit M
MNQRDMKRMVAYSSVNHMGYCLLGMAAITGTNAAAGLSGAMVQMVTHGIITGSLFLLVGVLYDQAHTRNIDEFGGLGARLPIFAGIMTVQAMASLACRDWLVLWASSFVSWVASARKTCCCGWVSPSSASW